MHKIAVAGTRSVQANEWSRYEGLFNDFLVPFAAPGTHFYLGGAIGIDTLALAWLARETSALITVALPAALTDQPEDARKAVAEAQIAGRVDEVIQLGAPELTAGAYHARNRWMVDRSDLVIGFPRGDRHSSGTWFTLRYAGQMGKPRMIVPV